MKLILVMFEINSGFFGVKKSSSRIRSISRRRSNQFQEIRGRGKIYMVTYIKISTKLGLLY